MIENPFAVLISHLIRLENLIIELKDKSGTIGPEPDRWLNLSELCLYLPEKPAKATVYAWIQGAHIPYHKKSKKLFFLRSEIDAWLKQGRKMANDELKEQAFEQITAKRRRR